MSGKHPRRSFLSPESIGRFVGTVMGPDWQAPFAEKLESGLLCRAGREAMATRFEVLYDSLDLDYRGTVSRAFDLIDELEAQLTVYRDSSEVSRLNRQAFAEEVEVEEKMFDLLLECRSLYEDTGGTFDVALHPLLEVWGLFKGPRRIPDEDALEVGKERSGSDKIRFDPEARTIRFDVYGAGINLAAIGKGYALDRVSERLEIEGLKNFLIHGGNSSIRACGSTTWEEGWLVDLAEPSDWSQSLGTVRLLDLSLSTSALGRETLIHGGIGHVLDPRSGRPAETDLASVSILHSSAARAEALSTALLVMGLDKALEYCENHPEMGAVLVPQKAPEMGPRTMLAGIARRHVEVNR
jgi:thiamine biosynthesis lipoprotein